jgi:glc operon protein GlcG
LEGAVKRFKKLFLLMGLIGSMGVTSSVGANPPAYGFDISLAQAKQVANAAADQAGRMNLKVAIAIVNTAGQLVYYEKADDTQTASIDVSIAKARSANNFKRATKVFEDAVASGRTAVLGLPGALPIEGGVPIVHHQKIIGAIGVSGASSAEDGIIAAAGLQALE